MANSLRAKLSKLRHDGHIDNSEYQELIKKLDGHDRELRAKAIEEFLSEICKKYTAEESQGHYQHFCVKIKNDIAKIAESMKGEKE